MRKDLGRKVRETRKQLAHHIDSLEEVRQPKQQQEREQLTVLADYALGIQTALNFEGAAPFVYPGVQAYDALDEIETSLQALEKRGHRLGCIGADCLEHTPNRAQASACLYTIDGCKLETTTLLAWTQYGMFWRAVFEDGCRFEENAPFNQVGWGFEDNDLAFQMEMKGYLNQRFFGMTYLHRAARSSIRIMREQGVDVTTLYKQRKQFVIDKWAATPQINKGPLVEVRRAFIR